MAKQGDSQALLVGVAVIAFALGRCTAGDAEPPRRADAEPQTLFDAPTEAPAAGGVPEAYAEFEDDTEPMPVVSHEASRAHGGRAFANCSEARAAGAAPVRSGDPGYAPRLDRDGDGIGCE